MIRKPHSLFVLLITVVPLLTITTILYAGAKASPVSQLINNQLAVEPNASVATIASGRIAFVSNRDGNDEIYTMNSDGTGVTRLTNHPSGEGYPAWSPDGSKIAFVSNRDGNPEIYTMNANGSNQTRLTYQSGTTPEWSPDGSKIAFASYVGNAWQIFFMNANGSGITQLTFDAQLYKDEPTWSPDGSKIAYRHYETIYIMNSDGSGHIPLTLLGSSFFPEWSPVNARLVMTFVGGASTEFDIYTVNTDGSNLTRLTYGPAEDWYPSWSPDGSQITFSTYRDGNSEIFVMNQNGSTQTRLTNNPATDMQPSWGTGSNTNCEVPFFWQRDPQWANHPLRTNGTCSSYCSTIGTCGCTLTSSTMLFAYYGANITPSALSDCMGTSACPFNWLRGASCSSGHATWGNKSAFSWGRLEQELNQNGRPVILGMHRTNNSNETHWVLVISGQGSDPANYVIHDPWFKGGANMRLDARAQNYVFDWLVIYSGQPACSPFAVAADVNIQPQPVLFSESSPGNRANVSSSAIVTGTALVYRMTSVTMTVQLTATSDVGNLTEMLIWTDSTPNTNWQPFTPFVWLPVSDVVFAQFRDEFGNESNAVSDTIYPVYTPPTFVIWDNFLPTVLRNP